VVAAVDASPSATSAEPLVSVLTCRLRTTSQHLMPESTLLIALKAFLSNKHLINFLQDFIYNFDN
jgi:hypothetical protein